LHQLEVFCFKNGNFSAKFFAENIFLTVTHRPQNFLVESGFSGAEVSEAFGQVLAAKDESNTVKSAAKLMLAALDHPRLREADLQAGTVLAKAFDFVTVGCGKMGSML
jgi:hypothetical protein